jgi:hypothetical protein
LKTRDLNRAFESFYVSFGGRLGVFKVIYAASLRIIEENNNARKAGSGPRASVFVQKIT